MKRVLANAPPRVFPLLLDIVHRTNAAPVWGRQAGELFIAGARSKARMVNGKRVWDVELDVVLTPRVSGREYVAVDFSPVAQAKLVLKQE